MYSLAIFDFDGTLVDSAPGIVEVMEKVIGEYKFPDETFQVWRNLIGVPLLKQMEIILPDREAAFHQEVAERYRAIYDTRVIEICPPFPGLWEVLAKLSENKVQVTIASSKRRNIIEPVLDYHNLSEHFSMVVGQSDVTNHKPHPEAVHMTIDKLNARPQDAVVIGDSSYDLEMARNAGVDGIGVTTGIHSRETLSQSNPLHIVDSLLEVLPLILNGRMAS